MKQRMTYHNIRNMILQLIWSGGYGEKFNYSNLHVDDCGVVEFDYSDDKDVIDHVSCLMSDKNGYEIIIKIVMFRNGSETGLGVVLRGDDKYAEMTCEYPDDGIGCILFRTRMPMIHHKATRRLLNRIYNRMMIPEMYKHACDKINDELLKRKEIMEGTDNGK